MTRQDMERLTLPPGGAGEVVLQGPFKDWEAICGAQEAEGLRGETWWRRHARCTVEGEAPVLGGRGPTELYGFVAIATYSEGGLGQGEGKLALKTALGWYIEALPSGDATPMLSHHSPVSGAYDGAASQRFEGPALQIVMRGGSSSFVPGMGSLGSSSTAWTRVRSCQPLDGGVRCTTLKQVWSQHCEVTAAATVDGGEFGPQGESTCRESGTNIPQAPALVPHREE